MGPPTELVLGLKERYNLQDFIETGTYYGNTAIWASHHFENVVTIEYSKEIYDRTFNKYGTLSNVKFVLGDSRVVLTTLVPQLTRPALFWLDAHWSGSETFGKDDECPLIGEIHAINAGKCAPFIFIDDARLFLSPPPRPHRIEQWPSIDEVVEALKCGNHTYYIVIVEDVIIAVPEYARQLVASYCQEINTKAWEEYGKRLNESAIKQGCRLVDQGFKLIYDGLRLHLKCLASKLLRGIF